MNNILNSLLNRFLRKNIIFTVIWKQEVWCLEYYLIKKMGNDSKSGKWETKLECKQITRVKSEDFDVLIKSKGLQRNGSCANRRMHKMQGKYIIRCNLTLDWRMPCYIALEETKGNKNKNKWEPWRRLSYTEEGSSRIVRIRILILEISQAEKYRSWNSDITHSYHFLSLFPS